MRRLSWRCVALLIVGVGLTVAAQAPQPGPEAKKLAMFAGSWKYEGEAKASPLGPAAKIAGNQTGRIVGGGFALDWSGQETGLYGSAQWNEIDLYDSAARTYRFLGYQNDGSVWEGTWTSFTGSVMKYAGTQTTKGIGCRTRGEVTFASDGRSYTQKAEISIDGKTWAPWWDIKVTKTR